MRAAFINKLLTRGRLVCNGRRRRSSLYPLARVAASRRNERHHQRHNKVPERKLLERSEGKFRECFENRDSFLQDYDRRLPAAIGVLPSDPTSTQRRTRRSPVQSVLCCQKLMQHRSGLQSVSQSVGAQGDIPTRTPVSLAGLMANCRFWILDESWASTRGNCFHAGVARRCGGNKGARFCQIISKAIRRSRGV